MEILKTLLAYDNSQIIERNFSGESALDLAFNYVHPAIADFLKKFIVGHQANQSQLEYNLNEEKMERSTVEETKFISGDISSQQADEPGEEDDQLLDDNDLANSVNWPSPGSKGI